MHERIKEQIQQQIEKYYAKLPKTIENKRHGNLIELNFDPAG